MEMCSSGTRFDSRNYLMITNLFFDAPSDLNVTREDLLSILEQFENLKRYRFQDENEHIHWTKAYVQFKDCYHAEQASAILKSMKYIKVELLSKIFNRFVESEEKIRTNPNCDSDSYIIVEITHSKFSYKDLFDKFSCYGNIQQTSDHGSFTILQYKTFCEALAAEIDNNKWNGDLHYLIVKILEQTKELTIRMMDSGNYFFRNACDNDILMDNLEMPIFNEVNDKFNKYRNVEGSSEVMTEPENITSKLSANEPQKMAFNLNDYTFYLQIIRKSSVQSNFDTDMRLSSGISVELSDNEVYGCTNIFSNNLSAEIKDSLSTKLQNLNVDEREYECPANIPIEPYDFCNIGENVSGIFDSEYTLNYLNCKRKLEKPDNKSLQKLGNAAGTTSSLPFYRCGVIDDYNYSDYFYPYFESVPPMQSSYSCSCHGTFTSTLSPWSIVPNVFIVPTTTFGRRRRNVILKDREVQEKEIMVSEPVEVPDFNETNFPPLGVKESLTSSKTLQISPKKDTLDSEKSRKIKKIKRNRKKSKQVNSFVNAKDTSFNDAENSTKIRIRKKRTSPRSITDKQNVSNSEISEAKFKSHNVSCQTLSSTTSEDKNECITLKCKKKINLKKQKETAIPIFSCSSNSTLNFRSSNKKWRRFKPEKW